MPDRKVTVSKDHLSDSSNEAALPQDGTVSDATPGPATQPEATQQQDWTVRMVLDWTIAHLKQHGSESPRLDAEILLAHARGCQRIQLYTNYDTPLEPEQRAKMRELVKRRATLEPVAYLVGFREFFGLDFEVGPGVFIPRPDTETLVVTLLEVAKEMTSPETLRVLDVCTGTGCIPISVAANCPRAIVTAVELDENVVKMAQRNAEKNNVASRVRILQGNLFEPLSPDAQFEFIASNPPYVTDEEMDELQPDVRFHEPHLALRGGRDGLDIVRRLLAEAPSRLARGGVMLMEIAGEQAETVRQLYAETGQFEAADIAKDLGGRSRVVWARKKQ
ncbi:MAG: peptide chain release factor N(5)-glutamine methyltransferase [Planctomycetota bacterium]|nr:peptide chain release factor N(5)-glutamine methyltransferase [Planctomycetota bacterium]MDA1250072.1 peptide chain release factor N(5)-glutamine methyltransferase [Planctomycetota bacterium]